MKRIVLAALLLCSLAAAGIANAVVPEQGIWWNPQQSGRGFGIEVQDDIVFVTYYGFDQNRNATFYTSLGILDPSTGVVHADFAAFDDGQCFGCTYRSPDGVRIGDAVFHFNTQKTGTITLPGNVVIPIERLGLFGTAPNSALLGTWHITIAIAGIYFGDMVWLRDRYPELDGGFIGNIVDRPLRIILGQPMDDGRVLILEDASENYYTAYAFEWAYNRWVGRSWTYLKTESLSGDGVPFFASRLLGKNLAEQAFGSTTTGGLRPGVAALHGIQGHEASDEMREILLERMAIASQHGDSEAIDINGTEVSLERIRQLARTAEAAF